MIIKPEIERVEGERHIWNAGTKGDNECSRCGAWAAGYTWANELPEYGCPGDADSNGGKYRIVVSRLGPDGQILGSQLLENPENDRHKGKYQEFSTLFEASKHAKNLFELINGALTYPHFNYAAVSPPKG